MSVSSVAPRALFVGRLAIADTGPRDDWSGAGVDKSERLRKAAERLRKEGRASKSRYTRSVYREAAAQLEAEAHDHDMAMARHEAMESRPVREFFRKRRGHAVAEQEIRAAVRKEVAEPLPANPALLALARSDADRVREQAWGEETGPTEGWLSA
jgi:hypothetical protein